MKRAGLIFKLPLVFTASTIIINPYFPNRLHKPELVTYNKAA